jgi:8-oxo-dGTP pyrophosphatase MutT (NUDIX family)
MSALALDLSAGVLRDVLSGYDWCEIMPCLRFAPRWPDSSTNPLYWQEGWRKKNPRQGAVMLLFVPRDGNLNILLTERHADLKHHAGELAFPGGRVELDDATLQAAALRETHEEIGLPASAIEVWGRLDGLYVPPSNFLVAPFTGLVLDPSLIRMHPDEVNAIVELPLRHLFDASGVGHTIDDQGRGIDYYAWQRHQIWGATARMLNNLCEALGQPCDASHLS